MSTTTASPVPDLTTTGEHRVTVNGGQLFAQSSGSGPPLLLVHGWPLDHRLFTRQVSALQGHLTVITYDRRGFGRSSAAPAMALELDDIDCLLNEFGFDSVHLLGMSQGGRIALRYAAIRPNRVRSLTLQGAAVDGATITESPEERVPVDEYAELASSGRVDEVKRRWLAHPLMRLPAGDGDAKKLINSIMADYSGADLEAHTRNSYTFGEDVLGRMSKFDNPVLILSGALETAARHAQAAQLLRLLPNGLEVILPESGHLANLTESDAYNRAVLDFIMATEAS